MSAMTTPVAPAFWAFFTFTVKLQVPRSMRAILPVMAPGLVSGEHASSVEVPLESEGSIAATSVPVIAVVDSGAPNCASPIG